MRLPAIAALLATAAFVPAAWAQAPTSPHNVVLFIADGLRPGMVNERTAPAMTALMQRGVRFTNTHSLFPTFTTANASGMATGHHLGDTGDFSNTIHVGFPVQSANGSVTPFIENDAVLTELDRHFGGDYLHQNTILMQARAKELSTAVVGKVGPALIFDHTREGQDKTIIVDDATGAGGVPLSEEMTKRLAAAQIAAKAPGRGANGAAGDNTKPGTAVANIDQQNWFADVTTKAVLPMFKERGKPFVLVYWSRDPDGTQHNQGDSLGRLVPGINGPTSLAAIRNADDNLARLLAALKEQGLDGATDVIITSDHGFSTISKESATSPAARQSYDKVVPGQLPSGFLALDLAQGLGMTLFDPDNKNAAVSVGAFPSRGNGLIGSDPANPSVVVAANGGSDLVYLPTGDATLAARIVALLSAQDYTSGLFVDEKLGTIPGTLPLSGISLKGTAATPVPAIVVNFRSFTTGCADPTTCGVTVSDTPLQQGQGMHGSFSRAETRNIMGAAGPGFRQKLEDAAPASNADLGMTIARLLGLDMPKRGDVPGRVLDEALAGGGAMPNVQASVVRSQPDANGNVTVVTTQRAGSTNYFDTAGYPGRTLGLPVSP
jgi:arylsulfatase A-like enzyme